MHTAAMPAVWKEIPGSKIRDKGLLQIMVRLTQARTLAQVERPSGISFAHFAKSWTRLGLDHFSTLPASMPMALARRAPMLLPG